MHTSASFCGNWPANEGTDAVFQSSKPSGKIRKKFLTSGRNLRTLSRQRASLDALACEDHFARSRGNAQIENSDLKEILKRLWKNV
jgi:hypothetical protein